MKVICIGAGMCGIAVGCMFPEKIPNLELVIYEKNTDVGGTWFENQYVISWPIIIKSLNGP
jgi:cation diffusion facilitator CzcD-associated flavoprotein CzcO